MSRSWPLWGAAVVAAGVLVVVLSRSAPPDPVVQSNEIAAWASLRNLISAQSQFQSTGRADENHNGEGEYGSLGELSGAVPVRGGVVFDPPALPEAFREITRGRVERNGYFYRIYLPRVGDGAALRERPEGGYDAGAVDPGLAERVWCAYAWPKDARSGGRTFFVNQEGDIMATEGAYAGDREPSAHAAFDPGSSAITGKVADHAQGQDGNVWKLVG
jgi:hypothetical protein